MPVNGLRKIKEFYNKSKIGFLLIQAVQISITAIISSLYSSAAEVMQGLNFKNYIPTSPFSINSNISGLPRNTTTQKVQNITNGLNNRYS